MAIRQRTDLAAEAAAVSPVRCDAMPHGDILASYVALLCLGKSDFEAIDAFRDDPYFLEALGLRQVPSAATVRQRLDANAPGFKDAISKYPPAKPGALVCEPLQAANRGR
jgi:hypothetical protein